MNLDDVRVLADIKLDFGGDKAESLWPQMIIVGKARWTTQYISYMSFKCVPKMAMISMLASCF